MSHAEIQSAFSQNFVFLMFLVSSNIVVKKTLIEARRHKLLFGHVSTLASDRQTNTVKSYAILNSLTQITLFFFFYFQILVTTFDVEILTQKFHGK